MQGLAAEALKGILEEYIEELDDRDPTELHTAEQIAADVGTFVSERMPAEPDE